MGDALLMEMKMKMKMEIEIEMEKLLTLGLALAGQNLCCVSTSLHPSFPLCIS